MLSFLSSKVSWRGPSYSRTIQTNEVHDTLDRTSDQHADINMSWESCSVWGHLGASYLPVVISVGPSMRFVNLPAGPPTPLAMTCIVNIKRMPPGTHARSVLCFSASQHSMAFLCFLRCLTPNRPVMILSAWASSIPNSIRTCPGGTSL